MPPCFLVSLQAKKQTTESYYTIHGPKNTAKGDLKKPAAIFIFMHLATRWGNISSSIFH